MQNVFRWRSCLNWDLDNSHSAIGLQLMTVGDGVLFGCRIALRRPVPGSPWARDKPGLNASEWAQFISMNSAEVNYYFSAL